MITGTSARASDRLYYNRPLIHLQALDFCRHLLRPAAVELVLPSQHWSRHAAASKPAPLVICSMGVAAGHTLTIHPSLLTASRNHARIVAGPTAAGNWSCWLYDDSKNGLWVNGAKIDVVHKLAPNDLIAFPGQALVLRFWYDERTRR